ncbi:MAG: hypothetical protein JNK65_02540 [Deltaproteobacteria bacterium]|nr:hypothetical protein [Deltaproteobacteria bacterium]
MKRLLSGMSKLLLVALMASPLACSGGGSGSGEQSSDNLSAQNQLQQAAKNQFNKTSVDGNNKADTADMRFAAWKKFLKLDDATFNKAKVDLDAKLSAQLANPVEFNSSAHFIEYTKIAYRYDLAFQGAIKILNELNSKIYATYAQMQKYLEEKKSNSNLAMSPELKQRVAEYQKLVESFAIVTQLAQTQLVTSASKLGIPFYPVEMTPTEMKYFEGEKLVAVYKDTINSVTMFPMEETGTITAEMNRQLERVFENVALSLVEGGEKLDFYHFGPTATLYKDSRGNIAYADNDKELVALTPKENSYFADKSLYLAGNVFKKDQNLYLGGTLGYLSKEESLKLQIEELNKKIEELDKDIKEMQSQSLPTFKLQEQRASLTEKRDELKKQLAIEEIKSQIAELDKQIKEMQSQNLPVLKLQEKRSELQNKLNDLEKNN